ncbi:MAG TPA: hypothetical protein PLL36_08945 [Candidatus Hydrogenedentes bacterium]|nr:hypothetical protein [Candidatus Hydrogenedentota bacterium]
MSRYRKGIGPMTSQAEHLTEWISNQPTSHVVRTARSRAVEVVAFGLALIMVAVLAGVVAVGLVAFVIVVM